MNIRDIAAVMMKGDYWRDGTHPDRLCRRCRRPLKECRVAADVDENLLIDVGKLFPHDDR